MATLDIKASTLRAKESAELQAAVAQELAQAKARVEDQEQSISALLNEKTLLQQSVVATSQQAEAQLSEFQARLDAAEEEAQAKLAELEAKLRESDKKNAMLHKKLEASKKPAVKPEEGKPVVVKNDKGEVAKEIHASKPKDS